MEGAHFTLVFLAEPYDDAPRDEIHRLNTHEYGDLRGSIHPHDSADSAQLAFDAPTD